MKILIDTNVLLSTFVFGGAASLHLKRLIQSDDELIISSYVDEEFKEKLEEKWPQRAKHLYSEFHKIQSFHFVDSTTEHLASMELSQNKCYIM